MCGREKEKGKSEKKEKAEEEGDWLRREIKGGILKILFEDFINSTLFDLRLYFEQMSKFPRTQTKVDGRHNFQLSKYVSRYCQHRSDIAKNKYSTFSSFSSFLGERGYARS